MRRCSIHNHTYYSNIRILDAICKPEELIDRAVEMGLSGIAITEHGNVCSAPIVNFYEEEVVKKAPYFKVILGSEIYLCDTREPGQHYYHCVLLAKNAIGHQMIRELSSIAWLNSYRDRGMERVVTLRSDIEDVIDKYGRGNVIMTQSCISGRINYHLLKMIEAEEADDKAAAKHEHDVIVDFAKWSNKWFGNDWYLEVAPAPYPDQKKVNARMPSLAKAFKKKIVIGDDAHRVRKEDYEAHKAFLNSKDGEREDIDKFYLYTYLQDENEIKEHLSGTGLDYDELVAASDEIYSKVERFSLRHKQHVPQVPVKFYPKEAESSHRYDVQKYPTLDYLTHSDNEQERYWVNYCQEQLEAKGLNNETYLAQLETEADIQKVIGEKLETCIFSYPVFLQHYIDLIWECGSTVGVARGSSVAGLNHYLLGLTQLDSIREGIPYYWRFLNKERIELPDVDLDFAPEKREAVFQAIRKERGELGVVQVCTFGTMTARSACQSAMKGYRSAKYPNGLDVDSAKYLTNLIPSERGFTWPIKDVVYGNKEKKRKPCKEFIQEVKKYPGLLDVILRIEGCVSHRGTHASGVLFFEPGHEFDEGAIMRSPDGSIVTQYDLHSAEACGATKYDFLLTEIQSIITESITLLQKYGKIDPRLSLREAYDAYIHPNKLPLDPDSQIWDDLAFKHIPHKFQFDSTVGSQTVKMLQPHTPHEMADANSIMRLMKPETWSETPSERYVRMKSDMTQWYTEMAAWHLTKDEQKSLEKHYLPVYATPCQQEQLMLILMDEDVCGFTLAEANSARKVVAKKQMDKIPQLKEKVISQAKSENLGKYVWETAVEPQCGYAFSLLHSTAYSYIGLQTVYIDTNWSEVFWETACMRVESGLGGDDATNYKKIAKAVCSASANGVSIVPVDINKSGYSFEPDEESHSILYGMKGLTGINGDMVEQIVANRPYISLTDFLEKNGNLSKTAVISLIKCGAFDEIQDRRDAMREYLLTTCGAKSKLTLQNFQALVDNNVLPESLTFQIRLYRFNKSLKAKCKEGDMLRVEKNYYTFYAKFFDIDALEPINGSLYISQKTWKKMYDKGMEPAKTYLKEHQDEALEALNGALLAQEWSKYAEGSVSAWEMDSTGYYFQGHELANLKYDIYGIAEFDTLDVDAPVQKRYNGIPICELTKIAGTVIAKDDVKSTVTLLTPRSGVVDVKFKREEYAAYNRQLSEILKDGTKKVLEKSWFNKGTKLIVCGFRRNDMFVAKKYRNTQGALVYRIDKMNGDGTAWMTCRRANEEEQ